MICYIAGVSVFIQDSEPDGDNNAPGILRRLAEKFRHLKVAQKLMLISVFFLMPDSLMLYLFITGINTNIEFAKQEMKGNEYQRPLEDLLQILPRHAMTVSGYHSND